MGYPLILPKNAFDSSHLAENRVQGLESVNAGGKCACPAQSLRPPADIRELFMVCTRSEVADRRAN